jgi:CMP-N,N'-diacetyllegionaminic acid synthase
MARLALRTLPKVLLRCAGVGVVALIPARAGSKRIPGKNTKLLAGHPLLAYTIAAATDSGVFDRVIVSSEDPATWEIAARYGADVVPRAVEDATDRAPDIRWVQSALKLCVPRDQSFAILRPTSPFRSAETIRRAYQKFWAAQDTFHSLRAVRPVREHPYKMWTPEMKPFWPGTHPDGTPFHSAPTQSLPELYVQTSSFEMAWTWVVEQLHTISGRKLQPFITDGYDSLSLDTPDDWQYAEYLIATGRAVLPAVAPVAAAALPTAAAA